VAKSIDFGIIYGATPDGMADDYLNGDRILAVELLETYFERFKRIKTYIEECHKQAREFGYVRSILGDKLIIDNPHLAASLRKAQNYAIQSSASCIAGWGLWEVCKQIKKLGLRSYIFGFTHVSGDFDTHIKSLFPVIDLAKTTLEKDIERRFNILTKVDFQL
jgi:DNA polymerase-1